MSLQLCSKLSKIDLLTVKLFIVKSGAGVILKTDVNFEGTNTRHMSRSGKSQCISFYDKTLPLKMKNYLRRITQNVKTKMM